MVYVYYLYNFSSGKVSTSCVMKYLLPSTQKPIYEKPKSKDFCLRCQKRVYPMDKLGPIKEVLYHKMCFTCVKCGTVLDLKNFHHNPNDSKDLSVFCGSHKPKEKVRSIDANAVQIKSALAAPRLDKV